MPYYELMVRGRPDVDVRALASELGMRCTVFGRAARLDGELVDRAALHGVIATLHRLGLVLLALERRPSRHAT